jgi:hypothetical protein
MRRLTEIQKIYILKNFDFKTFGLLSEEINVRKLLFHQMLQQLHQLLYVILQQSTYSTYFQINIKWFYFVKFGIWMEIVLVKMKKFIVKLEVIP